MSQEAPVLILRTTAIRSCLPHDERRACSFCKAELCLTPQRKGFLVEGARFACVGCLGAIPQAAQVLGPRTFSYEELSARTGVRLGDEPKAVATKPEEPKAIDPAHPWNKYVEKKTEKWREEVVVAKAELTERTCALESCGQAFTPGRRNQRFHSKECNRAFFDGQKKGAPRPRRATVTTTKHENGTTTTEAVVQAGGKKVALPPEVGVLIAIAELEPAARKWVLGWAAARWSP